VTGFHYYTKTAHVTYSFFATQGLFVTNIAVSTYVGTDLNVHKYFRPWRSFMLGQSITLLCSSVNGTAIPIKAWTGS